MKRTWVVAVVAGGLTLSACTGGGGSSSLKSVSALPTGSKAAQSVSGNITYLTHRTDLDHDGTIKKWIGEFNTVYPNVHVSVQSDTNYNPDTVTKLNSGTVPDVLDIPPTVPSVDLPRYFVSLGSSSALASKYNWTDNTAYKGQTYGLAPFGNVSGMIVNSSVWSKAGIDVTKTANWPKSPAQFIADLQAIKAKEASVVPYYTNYHDGWPTNWNGALGSVSCSPNANNQLADTNGPWSPLPDGSDLDSMYNLEYNVVHDGLVERDPTTTNWENSKTLIAKGQVGTMFLASWAVPQLELAAKTAGVSTDDISIIPFPQQVGGKWCPVAGPDVPIGISTTSKHAQAAHAFVNWLLDKSIETPSNNGLPTLKSGTFPSSLALFKSAQVSLLALSQSKATAVSNIDNHAKIGLGGQVFTQHIIDLARGAAASGSLQSYFANLNSKWAAARKATDNGTKTS